MLRTKCILELTALRDGKRVSVMSRHTLSDGKTLDLRITPEKFSEHRIEFAPPLKLVGAYYRREISWKNYEIEYLKHIRQPSIAEKVKELALQSRFRDYTLLCIEEYVPGEPLKCHRRLLAEECKLYEPNLLVYIR